MFDWLPNEMQEELAQLAQQYGPPALRTVEVDGNSYLQSNRTRRCEVCMVVRRPNGHLLTVKKTFYPPDAYRLPTGGVERGETIQDALWRELQEETSLTAHLRSFLGALVYRVERRPCFATFAFLLQETGGTLGVSDPEEYLEAYGEIAIDDLPGLIERLNCLKHLYSPAIESYWDDWGRFRAAVHQLVWDCLRTQR